MNNMQWISTKDRLPEIDSWVLVLGNNCIEFACMFIHEDGECLWRFFNSNSAWERICKQERGAFIRNDTTRAISLKGVDRSLDAIDITHWRPLPMPLEK